MVLALFRCQLEVNRADILKGGAPGEGATLAMRHVFPSTIFWNLGFFRTGSNVGSILSHPGDR
jgi:hypothetical protein